jgi:hypothetical protein
MMAIADTVKANYVTVLGTIVSGGSTFGSGLVQSVSEVYFPVHPLLRRAIGHGVLSLLRRLVLAKRSKDWGRGC